jgi:hypothetical protein
MESTYPEEFLVIDIMDDLESFLRAFEALCSSRSKLAGQRQLACFYAVLLFSIVKGLMIDAFSLRAGYESTRSWRDVDAVRINSSYKAIVSVFCWAARSDLMLESVNVDSGPSFEKDLEDTRNMVRTNEWTTWGVKRSKDFLIALGSGLLPDRTFNGFFVQRFGLSNMASIVSKPSNELKDIISFRPEDTFVTVGFSPDGTISSDFDGASELQPQTSPSGFVAFAPSPPEIPSTSTSNSWRKLKPVSSPGWAHIVVDGDGFRPFGHEHGGDGERRKKAGVRTGALDPEAKEKARRIRQMRACWNCWIQKIPVSRFRSSIHHC